jgi:hypothetical protein
MSAGFYRETAEKPNFEHSQGEALGVRKLACAFHIVNIINALKAAASLPHSKGFAFGMLQIWLFMSFATETRYDI